MADRPMRRTRTVALPAEEVGAYLAQPQSETKHASLPRSNLPAVAGAPSQPRALSSLRETVRKLKQSLPQNRPAAVVSELDSNAENRDLHAEANDLPERRSTRLASLQPKHHALPALPFRAYSERKEKAPDLVPSHGSRPSSARTGLQFSQPRVIDSHHRNPKATVPAPASAAVVTADTETHDTDSRRRSATMPALRSEDSTAAKSAHDDSVQSSTQQFSAPTATVESHGSESSDDDMACTPIQQGIDCFDCHQPEAAASTEPVCALPAQTEQDPPSIPEVVPATALPVASVVDPPVEQAKETVGWKDFDDLMNELEDIPLLADPVLNPHPTTPAPSPLHTGPRRSSTHPLRRESMLFTSEEHGLSTSVEELAGLLLSLSRSGLSVGTDVASLALQCVLAVLPAAATKRLSGCSVYMAEVGLWLEVLLALLLLALEVVAEVVVRVWRIVKPYKPGLLLFALGGLTTCLFGGYFELTIASIEAFRLCGYTTTLHSLRCLAEDVQRVLRQQREEKEARRREEEERREKRRSQRRSVRSLRLGSAARSVSGKVSVETEQVSPSVDVGTPVDGAAATGPSTSSSSAPTTLSTPTQASPVDAPLDSLGSGGGEEVSPGEEGEEEDLPWLSDEEDEEETATSKSLGSGHVLSQLYALLSQVDPVHLTEVVIGLNSGLLSVLTTLKLQFAKTVTLGNALAAAVDPPARAVLFPRLEGLLPVELRRWAPTLFKYSMKLVAITLAWRLRRVIASYHSALRGGAVFSKYLSKYLVAMKVITRLQFDDAQTVVLGVGYAVAALGLWFQLTHTVLPFPLNWVLFPASVLETVLMWTVNHPFAFLPGT